MTSSIVSSCSLLLYRKSLERNSKWDAFMEFESDLYEQGPHAYKTHTMLASSISFQAEFHWGLWAERYTVRVSKYSQMNVYRHIPWTPLNIFVPLYLKESM